MENLTRRQLLVNVAAVAGGALGSALAAPEKTPPDQNVSATPVRYTATVPDTLDLAERAKLAINALIGQIEPKFDYECWWRMHLVPLSIDPHPNQWFDQNTRTLWALALLRAVTGSDYGLDLEQKMRKSMLARTSEDGLYFNAPFDTPGAWWRAGGAGVRKKWPTTEEFTNPAAVANLLNECVARYRREGDKSILAWGQKHADALSRIVIQKEDYAYYPATADFGADYSYLRKSGWPDTKEATSDQDDAEGAVTAYHALVVAALSNWHSVTNDTRALETGGKIVRYMLKPWFWTGGATPWSGDPKLQEIQRHHGGAERKPSALFQGHQAGMTYTFTGLIDYATAANDAPLKQWVRQGYEHFRNLGLSRIGMWGENIANNQMAMIAIKLSDAGAGDYWDDVDEYVRNAFVEDQYTDLELVRQEAQKSGEPTKKTTPFGELTLERVLGTLRHEGLIDSRGTLDPTSNVAKDAGKSDLFGSAYLEAFYYAWEAITRYREGIAQVNLLLNRASGWLDIDSHLPYEGKVVLRNKACKGIHIRIPAWVDRKAITCEVGGKLVPFSWAGNFMVLQSLTGSEYITLQFPMVETVETCYLLTRDVGPRWWDHTGDLPQYILHMRGNTCVKAEFPNRAKFTRLDPMDPVYQRDHYRRPPAPLKTVTRYVSADLCQPVRE